MQQHEQIQRQSVIWYNNLFCKLFRRTDNLITYYIETKLPNKFNVSNKIEIEEEDKVLLLKIKKSISIIFYYESFIAKRERVLQYIQFRRTK